MVALHDSWRLQCWPALVVRTVIIHVDCDAGLVDNLSSGICSRGSHCGFAHSLADLAPPVSETVHTDVPRPGKPLTELFVTYFQSGLRGGPHRESIRVCQRCGWPNTDLGRAIYYKYVVCGVFTTRGLPSHQLCGCVEPPFHFQHFL